jgi:hypothetical protein
MKINPFIILVFCIICTGCPPCRNSKDCNNQYLGNLNLSDTTSYWVPYSGSTQLTFKNSNGYTGVFTGNGFTKDSTQRFLAEENGYSGCDPAVPCYKYYNFESRTFHFSSDSIPTKINIIRTKNTGDTYNFNNNFSLPLTDILKITINNYSFAVNFNNDSILFKYDEYPTETEFFDSIEIMNKIFYNVYHSHYPGSSYPVVPYYPSSYFIHPIGIFYNKTQGLLGFYLTNNEIWVLQ